MRKKRFTEEICSCKDAETVSYGKFHVANTSLKLRWQKKTINRAFRAQAKLPLYSSMALPFHNFPPFSMWSHQTSYAILLVSRHDARWKIQFDEKEGKKQKQNKKPVWLILMKKLAHTLIWSITWFTNSKIWKLVWNMLYPALPTDNQ